VVKVLDPSCSSIPMTWCNCTRGDMENFGLSREDDQDNRDQLLSISD